jgi:hypothetical protein
MRSRAIRTKRLDNRFFGAIATGQTVSAAALVSGYSRRAVYDWRAAAEAFRERWDEAVAMAIERMEAEADRRAVKGTLEPVFYKGTECGHVRRYSDTLLIFRLKALDPKKYRERASFEHTGKNGEPLIPEPQEISKVALALLKLFRDGRSDEAATDQPTAK